MRRFQFVAVLLVAAVLAACGAGHPASSSSANTPGNSGGSGNSGASGSGGSGTTGAGSSSAPNTVPLSAETSNNTSAANSFSNQSNGNLGANNVSKVNIHSLLYSGATTKVFVQYLLWFGQPDHMNVGYTSDSATQVQNQINDMVSRGIDGVIIDWYGPNNAIDQAAQLVMQQAEQHPGFQFAIMVDAGAIGANSQGGSPQQTLIQLMQYVEQKYFSSSAYMKINGQPVVTNFNIDQQYQIDWNAVNAALPTPPRFLFQDNDGFTHILTDGSYSWVMPQVGDFGLGYLQNFYSTAMAFSNLETMGATYKGFNDTLASWSTNRVMDQQCGQTWLQTFQQINNQYNVQNQLPYLQLVTWNDYEEGTEIESGIDNCFSLNPSMSGNTLEWTINGDESTIDHYAVYASPDGNNLQQITQVQPGTHSVDLCSAGVPAGTTQVFVQAVGKPSIANRMPGPVAYSGGCS
jgi:Glycosyl hydrolase family 71